MLVLEPGPATRLQARSMRLASCWRITRLDGTIYRFTTHDRIIAIREDDGALHDFTPVGGVDPTSREMPNGLEDVNLEVDGAIGTISSADLRSGLFRAATVEEFIVDWRYPWAGALTSHRYTIESTQFNGEDWKADLSGITRALSQRKGERHSRRCVVDVGSARCTVDLGPFTTTGLSVGIVSSSVPLQVFTFDGVSSEGDGYYTEGQLTWTSGANAGLVSEIQQSLDRDIGAYTVTLYLPTPNDIEVGDTFTIIAGCNKTAAVCRDRFGNLVNFQGFPTMPGTDKSLQGP